MGVHRHVLADTCPPLEVEAVAVLNAVVVAGEVLLAEGGSVGGGSAQADRRHHLPR